MAQKIVLCWPTWSQSEHSKWCPERHLPAVKGQGFRWDRNPATAPFSQTSAYQTRQLLRVC